MAHFCDVLELMQLALQMLWCCLHGGATAYSMHRVLLAASALLGSSSKAASLGFLQVECPSVTPSVVLEASGHVERFTDFMVQDALTKECHRADHLLEDALETALRDAAKNSLSPERIEANAPANPPASCTVTEIGSTKSSTVMQLTAEARNSHT